LVFKTHELPTRSSGAFSSEPRVCRSERLRIAETQTWN
jgi:hypothetical protein